MSSLPLLLFPMLMKRQLPKTTEDSGRFSNKVVKISRRFLANSGFHLIILAQHAAEKSIFIEVRQDDWLEIAVVHPIIEKRMQVRTKSEKGARKVFFYSQV